MKKQYRYIKTTCFKVRLYTYHNGELVDSKEMWLDEADKEMAKLELDGYIYGYTQEEVEEAKKKYEEMLKNIIEEG